MERDRAVRVDDALWLPGGAARVTHRCRRALVEIAVGEVSGIGARQQLLEVDRARRGFARTDRDHVLEVNAVTECLDERPEHLVGDEYPIARVSCDVGEVIGMEPQVQRVGDEATDRVIYISRCKNQYFFVKNSD